MKLAEKIKVLYFTAIVICFLPVAHAHDHGNAWVFDKSYGQVGKWRVLGGTEVGDTCVAEQDNQNVTLRVMYTEYTGDWFIGNPYYERDNPIASFGTGAKGFTNDAIQMQSNIVNSWAMYNFSSNPNLLSGEYLSLGIDRGIQSWPMADKDTMIAKLRECAVNLGDNRKAASMPKKNPLPPLVDGACPVSGSLKSPPSNEHVSVEFRDATFNQRAKSVYWIDFEGKLIEMGPIFEGKVTFSSYKAHKFLVKDSGGKCYGGFFDATLKNNIFTIK